MGDPFSVAGTAVGIISLGIQTCQILFQYYSEYRGFDDDIGDVLRRVKGLEGILKGLETVKEKIEVDNHEPSSQLHIALKTCEVLLQRLKRFAEKCDAVKESNNSQDWLRKVGSRLLWPFRKETVMELRATLSGFQDNLSLALQILGLDVALRQWEHLSSKADAILDRSSRVECVVTGQSVAIRTIGHDLQSVSDGQREHTSYVSQEMAHLRTEVSAYGTSTEQKLDLIISSLAKFHNPSTIPPAILAETIDSVHDVQPEFRSALKYYKASHGGGYHLNKTATDYRLCGCHPRKKQSWSEKRWMSVFSEQIYEHEAHCPQHSRADFSRTIAARITVCTQIVRFCVLVGWQQSRKSGWNASIPVLKYRAIVPPNSPAFKPFMDAETLLGEGRYTGQAELSSILLTILDTLRQNFRNGASPTDVNEDGIGIFTRALSFVKELVLYGGLQNMNPVCSFLDACINEGVPYDQADRFGRTPIMDWQELFLYASMYERSNLARDLLYHLARRFGCWSFVDHTFIEQKLPNSQYLYDAVSHLLTSEEINEGLDVETPLLRSILRRSENDFCSNMMADLPERLASALTTFEYAKPLASWPSGLNILLASDRLSAYDNYNWTARLWKEAVILGNAESIELLIYYGIQVTLDDWYLINFGIHNRNDLEVNEARYKKAYSLLAKSLRDTRPDDIFGEIDSGKLHTPKQELPVYHTSFLSTLAAENLWEAGHWDIHTVQFCDNLLYIEEDTRSVGTPLWACSAYNPGPRSRKWSTIKWYIHKGANVGWIHPWFLTTPAHLITRLAIRETAETGALDRLIRVENLVQMPHRDGCSCYCSQGGCCVIGCGTSKYAYRSPYSSRAERRRNFRHHQQHSRPYLYSFVEKDKNAVWMSSAILRILTFEELSLTHTCCYRIWEELHSRFQRPTAEEAQIIHDIEREDIGLLDHLVAEFENAWENYPGTFEKFLRRVWKPRMRQERRKKKSTEEISRETGVHLKRSPDHELSGSEISEEDTEDEDSEAGTTDGDGLDEASNDEELDGYATAAEDHE